MPIFEKKHNTDNFIYYQIPVGKPDPNVYVKPEETPSKYVDRPAQTTMACIYYGFNLLRKRYGKAPEIQHLPTRQDEHFFSAFRKKSSEHYDKQSILSELNEKVKLLSRELQIEQIKEILKSIISALKGELDEDHKKEATYIKEYCEQFINTPSSTSFKEFCDSQFNGLVKTYSKEHIQAFEKYNIDYKQIFKDNDFNKIAQYKDTTFAEQCNIFENFLHLLMAKQYGLQYVPWNPEQDFAHFMQHLNQYGPLAIVGTYGLDRYKEKPSEFKDNSFIHPVNFWPKSKAEKNDMGILHTIVVVGAKLDNKGQQLVYYVDPSVASPAGKPEKTPLFCISYKTLTEDAKLIADGMPNLLKEGYQLRNSYALAPPLPTVGIGQNI
jgi:hypothetical protein